MNQKIIKRVIISFILLAIAKLSFSQVPVMSNISPAMAAIGDPCIISGNNFGTNANNIKVYFGNASAQVMAVNNNTITVKVPVGVGDCKVRIYQGGKKSKQELRFTYTLTTPLVLNNTTISNGMTNHKSFITNDYYYNLISADLNGDMYPDKIIIDKLLGYIIYDTITRQHVRYNIDYSLPDLRENIGHLFLEDLNGDGQLDISISTKEQQNLTKPEYTIFLNQLNTFHQTGIAFKQVKTDMEQVVALFDLNSDGLSDYLMYNASYLYMYINKSQNDVHDYEYGGKIFVGEANVFDIDDYNGDNKADIYFAKSDSFFVLRNISPQGTFNATSFAPAVGFTKRSLGNQLTDMNNDGLKDLLYLFGSNVFIRLNTSTIGGPINYNPEVQLLSGYSFLIADLNGDGKKDIFTNGYPQSTTRGSLYENTSILGPNSIPTFVLRKTFSSQFSNYSYSIMDANDDGKVDIGTNYFIPTNHFAYHNITPTISDTLTSNIIQKKWISGRNAGIYVTSQTTPNLLNNYTLEISDEYGTFGNPVYSQTIASDSAFVKFNFTIPVVSQASNNYKIKVTRSNPYYEQIILDSLLIVPENPNLISVSNQGFGVAGQTLTLTGTGFNTFDNTVFIGGKQAKILSVVPNQIIVEVPKGATTGYIVHQSVGYTKRLDTKFNYQFDGTKGNNLLKFGPATVIAKNQYYTSPTTSAADIDNNGKVDIPYTLEPYNFTKSPLEQIKFKETTERPVLNNFNFHQDFDGDGTPDRFYIQGYSVVVKNTTLQFNSAIIINADDLNNDGLCDLVVLQTGVPIKIYTNITRLGEDTVKFSAPITYPLTSNYSGQSFCIADIDNDNRKDIIVGPIDINTTNINLCRNTTVGANITFTSPATFNTGYYSIENISATDLNNDGYLDLIALCKQSNQRGKIFFFTNKGTAATSFASTFNAPSNYTIQGTNLTAITAYYTVDWDGDHNTDIYTFRDGTDSVFILRNTQVNGNFSASTIERINHYARPIILLPIDLDENGSFDLITGHTDIFCQKNASPRFTILNCKSSLVLGDTINVQFARDSVANLSGQIQLQLSDSAGKFINPTVLAVKTSTNSTDLISAPPPTNLSPNQIYKIRLVNTTNNSFTDTVELRIIPLKQPIVISNYQSISNDTLTITGSNLGEINTVKFGTKRAVIIQKTAQQLQVKLPARAICDYIYFTHNNGTIKTPNEFVANYVKRTPNFQIWQSTKLSGSKPSIGVRKLVDLNNDGFTDVIEFHNDYIYVNLNDGGKETLTSVVDLTRQNNVTQLTTIDFDSDGDEDILYLASNSLFLLENKLTNGILIFEQPKHLITKSFTTSFYCGDFTGKQGLDIVMHTEENNATIFYTYHKNTDEDASFELKEMGSLMYLNCLMNVKITDLDNNGIDDLLMTKKTGDEQRIYALISRTSGNIWLFDTTSIATSKLINEVYACDLDNDSKKEIITKSGFTLNVMKNNSTNGFTFQQFSPSIAIDSSYGISVNKGISVVDFDFDGIKDIVLGTLILRGKSALPSSIFTNYLTGLGLSGVNETQYIFADLNNDNKPDAIRDVILTNILPTIAINPIKEKFFINKSAQVSFNSSQITFDSNNAFRLVLSDSTGNFNTASATVLATKNSINSDTFSFIIPATLSPQNLYKLRVESTHPKIISDNELTLPLFQIVGPITAIPNKAQIGEQIKLVGSGLNAPINKIVVYFNRARAKVISATDSVLTVVVPPNANHGLISVSIEDYTSNTLLPFTVISPTKNKFDSTCFSSSKEIGNVLSLYSNKTLIDADGDGFVEFYNKTYNYDSASDSILLNDTYTRDNLIYIYGLKPIDDYSGDGIPDAAVVDNTWSCSAQPYGTFYTLTTHHRLSKTNILRDHFNAKNNITSATNVCYMGHKDWVSGDFDFDGRNEVLSIHGYGAPLVMTKRGDVTSKPFDKHHLPTSMVSYAKQSTNMFLNERVLLSKGDYNLDGRLDIVTHKSVWLNRIDTVSHKSAVMNGLNEALTLTTPEYGESIFSADLNNDNKIDFGVFENDRVVKVSLNQSTPGNLSIAQNQFVVTAPVIISSVNVEDLNGDGKPELILGGRYIYRNTSTPNNLSFDTANKITLKYNHQVLSDLSFFDVNADGRLDAIGKTSQNKLIYFKNQFPVFGVKYPKSSFCFNDSLVVELNALDYSFGTNNNFVLQLSDSSGSFANPTTLSNITRVGNIFKLPMPANVGSGKNFKIRIIASAPSDTSSVPQFGFEIKPSFNVPNLTNITGVNVACAGDSILLQSSALNPLFGYKWLPTNDTINSNHTTAIKYAKQTGVYHVQTMYDGCAAKSNAIQLTFNSNPVSRFTLGINNKICSGDSILLIADTITNGSYRWYRNNTLLTDTISTIAIRDSGFYKLKLTNQNNCIAFSRDTFVSRVNKPIANLALNNGSAFCSGDSVTLSASNISNNKFKWRLNGTVLSNDSLATLRVKTAGNWGLQVTDINNCKSIWVDTLITVNNNPVVNYTFTQSGSCEGDSVIITANTPGVNSFSWYKNQAKLNNDSANTLTVKNNGAYRVKVTSSFGCSTQLTDTLISFNPKPLNTLTLTGKNNLCDNDSLTITAPVAVGYRYNWFKNGSMIANDTTNFLKVKNTGTYYLKIQNQFGCYNQSKDTQITFNPLPNISLVPLVSSAICSGDSVMLAAQTNATTTVVSWYKNNQSLMVSSNNMVVKEQGHYYALVVDNNLCQAYTDTISLSINPLPVVNLTTNNGVAFCQGDSSVISATSNPGNTYQWFLNNQTLVNDTLYQIATKTSGVYMVKVKDINACQQQADTTITVNALPATPVITKESNELVSSALNGNQWLLNQLLIPNATSKRLTISQIGNYQVFVTDLNGCKSDTSAPFVYTSVARINDAENLISLYPIPANQNFRLNSSYPIIELVIHDWSGKTVMSQNVENTNEIINVANLAPGIYAVKILVNNIGWITKTISIVR